MKHTGKIIQVAFTYMGTVVGAGFATGREILRFFTQYGWMATFTIALSSLLFVWFGTKLMKLAHDLGARSYEDLNSHLFGPTAGKWVSTIILFILLGISTVMLAGAGSIFEEHLHIPYQVGLIITSLLCYLVIAKGVDAILVVNSIVVPCMLIFTVILIKVTLSSPSSTNWLELSIGDYSAFEIWLSPFLYIAYNLALAQAVLVPIGASMEDKSILQYGGLLGGIGIGFMLLAAHFALSANMPDISQFQIPMGQMIMPLGTGIHLLFVLIIYSEIFTTLIADVYGLSLQIQQRTRFHFNRIVLGIICICYLFSQFGFKSLLDTLYPLFGMICMVWFVMLVWSKKTA